MTREEIKETVFHIVSELISCEVEEIEETSYLIEDLDIGSLEAFEMIGEVESIYKVNVSGKDIEHLIQIKDIIDYIFERKGN